MDRAATHRHRLDGRGAGETSTQLITGPEGVLATWTAAPVLFPVFAPDLPTLRTVIEAVIASG